VVTLRLTALPGVTYRLEFSTDLEVWLELGTVTASGTGEIVYREARPDLPALGFYRLVYP
jgi:hypothetical protein